MEKEISLKSEYGGVHRIKYEISDGWHSMDEQVPEPEGDDYVEYLVAVAEWSNLHNKATISYDIAYYQKVHYPNKSVFEFSTYNDWEEGTPWGIIAWKEMPELPKILD